jgi:hypothetical protein
MPSEKEDAALRDMLFHINAAGVAIPCQQRILQAIFAKSSA